MVTGTSSSGEGLRVGLLGHGELARSLLDSSHELGQATTTLPPCLTHGDFPAENLLVDEQGRLVVSGWQGVGFGSGTNDLAMWWQRAEADGADPPRADLLTIYADARGLCADQTLRTAVVASELLLMFGCPERLAPAPAARQAVMARRLRQLTDEWSALNHR